MRYDSTTFRDGRPLYVVNANGCWIWQGAIGTAGYGELGMGGTHRMAHRWSYERTIGPIPTGLRLHHRCRVRACINPDHLEPVTAGRNLHYSWTTRRNSLPVQPVAVERIPMTAQMLVSVLEARLWAQVDKTTGCWLWTGTTSPQGYGVVYDTRRRRNARAHRIAWELTNGPIPQGLLVCHNCPGGDRPGCCNPAHLWLGTSAENTADRDRKGRTATGDRNGQRVHPERAPRGERNGSRLHPERVPRGSNHCESRLSEDQVREIRQRHAAGGITFAALARAYGVSDTLIGAIVKRRTWKHLD